MTRDVTKKMSKGSAKKYADYSNSSHGNLIVVFLQLPNYFSLLYSLYYHEYLGLSKILYSKCTHFYFNVI